MQEEPRNSDFYKALAYIQTHIEKGRLFSFLSQNAAKGRRQRRCGLFRTGCLMAKNADFLVIIDVAIAGIWYR
ncbi:MAG: hypothetical protein KDE47_31430 [Caldilineaceae bacterium]|nr:hypothetical protein [Caldilineaceae bacterium]